MKKLSILAFLCIVFISCVRQEEVVNWSYPTGGRVLAHPAAENGIIYFGSGDRYMHAIDASTGLPIWTFLTDSMVLSKPVLSGDMLFFESGNTCYALDKQTGKLNWKFHGTDRVGSGKLDPWDYHHPAAVVDDSMVYFACGNGTIVGLDRHHGELQIVIESRDRAAIRSTPVIDDGILFFGDWNGIVYAWSIAGRDTLWTKRTYLTQPYSTFGMVNTEMIVYDSLLVFGARNPEIRVLNKRTGEMVWNYTVSDGGWISGDPLVHMDTLYIGGSDNHRMYAFDVHTGELYWEYEFLYNNFSKPVVAGDHILFTTGDAYAYQGANYGSGYVYALNRKDGSLLNFERIGGNAFTTPMFDHGSVILGSSDGNIYAVDSAEFLEKPLGLNEKGYRSVSFIDLKPNPFQDTMLIEYRVEYPSEVILKVITIDGNDVVTLVSGKQEEGKHTVKWDGRQADKALAPDGYFLLKLASLQYEMTEVILKK